MSPAAWSLVALAAGCAFVALALWVGVFSEPDHIPGLSTTTGTTTEVDR